MFQLFYLIKEQQTQQRQEEGKTRHRTKVQQRISFRPSHNMSYQTHVGFGDRSLSGRVQLPLLVVISWQQFCQYRVGASTCGCQVTVTVATCDVFGHKFPQTFLLKSECFNMKWPVKIEFNCVPPGPEQLIKN